ncbi:phage antirepressor KilAC domain-containing protein [Acinetobacter venetianus]|uniref:phage antirepressor KilAC domain-containing protein n=1 Tax=Acinetobacter venetianus TaxID=52133 RepID=UPI00214FDCF3|nr:phage antirepressor KilAC domain-containing protein [Acinetobacter venetianus]MCR4532485.1 phage antirepressor KilAC domain-containing protein [Acinetobacter venetianus]
MKKVPKVLGEGIGKFSETYIHPQNGQEYPCYRFPKREACLMAMSYSYELQAIVFDYMTKLEQQIAQPRILSRMDLIQIAYEAEQENIALQGKVAEFEPKALALDTIADTSNTYTIRECAKTIGIKEKHLVNLLLEKGWCYRESSGRLQPYAQKINQKIFINRPSPIITNPITGEEKVHLHMRVTAHGLTRITALVNSTRGG